MKTQRIKIESKSEPKYIILLGAGNEEYIWDGNFNTKDISIRCREDYSYSQEEIASELAEAKLYANSKYESGEWVVNGSDVYSQEL